MTKNPTLPPQPELLPCPFCGGEPRIWCDDVTLAACQQEDCPGYGANALIEDWNRRSPSPSPRAMGSTRPIAPEGDKP